jgi:pimeloyl-ACP methyl ester carboxylesterase
VSEVARPALPDVPGVVHETTTVNGIRLHYAEAGQGPPVVLLHGFPEFWYSWRHQLPALARAGYRCLAPDLRGYNASDRPPHVRNYRVRTLVEDVADLIRQVAGGSAFVVGHDWGGVLAWRLAAVHPELVRKLAILNAPHPMAYRAELKRNPGQWLRSWYVLFFQLPRLPEAMLRAGDFALLRRTWRRQPTRPDAFTAADIAAYRQALSVPGGLIGPVNYYRAALRYGGELYGPPQVIAAPTLVLWGLRDAYLSSSLTERLGAWVSDLRVERIAEASHWIQHDVPSQVSERLARFFAER